LHFFEFCDSWGHATVRVEMQGRATKHGCHYTLVRCHTRYDTVTESESEC